MMVNVQRHHYNSLIKNYEKWDIPFESEVYAIDGDSFLVYDPGCYLVPGHFEWYDIREHMFAEGEEEAIYFVTLAGQEDL